MAVAGVLTGRGGERARRAVPLLPREHGAYGQIACPLVAACAVAGVSAGGLLFAGALAAAFLAHEPALVVLGFRGGRAKRERGDFARRSLVAYGAAATIAGVGAWLVFEPAVRWSLAVPLLPAAVLAVLVARGAERSFASQCAAALAFSGSAMPVAMAGGVSAPVAVGIAVPFAVLFVSSTLAVRASIMRVRGGGDPRAVAATRRASSFLTMSVAIVLGALWTAGLAPLPMAAGAVPGLIIGAVVGIRPPRSARLRLVGWTLLAISAATTLIVIVTA